MPYAVISTNLPKAEIPSDFIDNFAEKLAGIMKKHIQAMTVILQTDLLMSRFGKSDPALCIVLRDVQPFDDKDKNRQISKDVISYVENMLNIEPARISIIFHPEDDCRVGLADGVLLYDRHLKLGKISPR
ncbi:Macrophage migration inhibitory factor [Holothuria leucospilota]|uniref:L-dopachrome isomerase n=1 Tax=Holothuria leucospilota TaxID=206669 RepID=A0A9Q1C5U6_HOLLE|nr:Macrophage migration inhibitory factor [Holothuria leucospilota]